MFPETRLAILGGVINDLRYHSVEWLGRPQSLEDNSRRATDSKGLCGPGLLGSERGVYVRG